MILFLRILCLFLMFHSVNGRKVSALADICARGAYSFCQGSQRDVPTNTGQQVQSSSFRAPLAATPPPLSGVAQYCRDYQVHYSVFCSGDKAKDAKAAEFCPTYAMYCSKGSAVPVATTPNPVLPPTQIQQICVDNEAMANQYCFRQVIPNAQKKTCELYLRSCVGQGNEVQSRTAQQIIRKSIRPCNKYYNDYNGHCVQNPKPYNNGVAEFCRNYKSACVPVTLPGPDTMLNGPAQAAPAGSPVAIPWPPPQLQSAQIQPAQLQPAQFQQVPQVQPFQADPSTLAQSVAASKLAAASNPVGTSGMASGFPNSNVVNNPVGSLGGNPATVTNPLAALSGTALGPQVGNWQSAVPNTMFPNPDASGMAAHPLAIGQQTSVGQMAGFGRGASINPFGQVGTGTTVNGGPVAVQSGQSVDFSGIPGLSQIGSIPGLGRRKRRMIQLLFSRKF